MANKKYGSIKSAMRGREYPVAASQFFRHDGVNAVYFDSNGHVALAVSATAGLAGIATVPQGMGAGENASYWKSSATAGKDKIFVTTAHEAEFLLPADEAVTQDMIGSACDLTSVNDGTATYVDVGTNTTDVFRIVGVGSDYGGGANDVLVQINKYQADT